MRILKIAESNDITQDMEDWFVKRTNMHISLVQKWCKIIENYDSEKFGGLIERGNVHDESKLVEPERIPYIYVTWNYKCKEDGKKFNPPKDIDDMMNNATFHHVKNNAHHPESHTEQTKDILNRKDRDKPPKEMVDATKMKDLDIGEMVADWMAMSNEKKTSPKDWADKNVNIRWKFTDAQKKLIYNLIEDLWYQ